MLLSVGKPVVVVVVASVVVVVEVSLASGGLLEGFGGFGVGFVGFVASMVVSVRTTVVVVVVLVPDAVVVVVFRLELEDDPIDVVVDPIPVEVVSEIERVPVAVV